MVETRKVKVKVKKRKLKIKKILFIFLLILLAVLAYFVVREIPTRNIYIIGNNNLSDKEIIELAGIGDYPSFLCLNKKEIKNKLEKSNYIKDVKVEKKLFNKLYIYVTEYKVICSYQDKLILESKEEINNDKNISSIPILINYPSDVYDNFVLKFALIDNNILLKISEIEYSPTEVDKERFILRMNDGNMVYVTLTKIEKINMYNSIASSMENKNGIIYLDIGDYIELR